MFSCGVCAFDSTWDTGHIDTKSKNPTGGLLAKNPCGRDGEGHGPSSGSEQGSPVELADGSLVWHETDIVVNGRFPLKLARTYSSRETAVGMFGKGWVASCERSLIKAQDYSPSTEGEDNLLYLLRLSNGKRFVFGDDNSNTAPPPGLWAEIIEGADQTQLKWRNGRIDTYVDGLLQEEKDGYGNYVQYTYTEERLTKISSNDGRWIEFIYDTERWVVEQARDNTGRNWNYKYNDKLELISVQSPSGTRVYTYFSDDELPPIGGFSDAYSFLKTVSDETGVQELSVDYYFDDLIDVGRVASYSEGLIHYSYEYVWEVVQTFSARVVSVIKTGNDEVTTYSIDDAGQISGWLGTHGSATFDRNEEYQSEVTVVPTGYTINTNFDDRGRPTSIYNGRGTTYYTYKEDHEKPVQITLPGEFGSFQYDLNAQGDVISVQDTGKNTYSIIRNGLGDIIRITLPGGERHWDFTYNSAGLISTVENPEGIKVQYVRNDRGFVEVYIDGNGIEWKYTYDQLGRKLSELSPEGALTQYFYDAAGRQTAVLSDSGESYGFHYDDEGRLVKENNFWGEDTTYTYAPGTYRLATVVDPNGNVTSYNYNGKNELVTKQTADQTINYSYDATGRLISISNANQTVDYEYNPYSEITVRNVDGVNFSYQYDALGRLTHYTTPAGEFVHTYSKLGLKEKTVSPAGEFTYDYDDTGRLTEIGRPNGVNTTYIYDDADRILSIAHGNVGSLVYSYDLSNRVTQKSGFGTTVDYSYDDDNRLTAVAYSTPLSDGTTAENFSYDSLGNRLGDGAVIGAGNRLLSDNAYIYEYDLNGNRTKKTNKNNGAYEVFNYSNWNQLIAYKRYESGNAQTPVIDATYVYGPEGRRLQKVVNGQVTSFLWSEDSLFQEQGPTGIRSYLGGLVLDQEEYIYPLNDHLSTTISVTDQNNGAVIWQGDYKAFGEQFDKINLTSWNMQFPGQYIDSESGLRYNMYRDYDPYAGRYIQSDPVGLAGGVNTFVYVQQNPVSFYDLLGLSKQYSVSLNGLLAFLIPGAGGTLQFGVSVPDDTSKLNCYQIYGGLNLNVLLGVGAYAGFGGAYNESQTEGALPIVDFSTKRYEEVDLGYAYSIGASRTGSEEWNGGGFLDFLQWAWGEGRGSDSPSGVSIPVLHKFGYGYGAYIGLGYTTGFTFATPTYGTECDCQ